MNDKPFQMAYEAHGKYLDADSATSGPIEDYIAEAIRETARRCAEIAEGLERAWWNDYKRSQGPRRGDPHWQGMSDGAAEVAAEIRREFGITGGAA